MVRGRCARNAVFRTLFSKKMSFTPSSTHSLHGKLITKPSYHQKTVPQPAQKNRPNTQKPLNKTLSPLKNLFPEVERGHFFFNPSNQRKPQTSFFKHKTRFPEIESFLFIKTYQPPHPYTPLKTFEKPPLSGKKHKNTPKATSFSLKETIFF